MLKGSYHSYMAMSTFFYLFHNFFTASLPQGEGDLPGKQFSISVLGYDLQPEEELVLQLLGCIMERNIFSILLSGFP